MSGSNLSRLDANQVLKEVYDKQNAALRTLSGGSLVPESYDSIVLTYITSGNGSGEIGTVTYSKSGSDFATLTLTYDASNRLETVTRS